MEVPEILIHANQVIMEDKGKRKKKAINYSLFYFYFFLKIVPSCFESGPSVVYHGNKLLNKTKIKVMPDFVYGK